MYEILSNLPESVAYTCINCTEQHPAEWRLALEKELQVSLRQVLTALLNSRTTSHLLRYRQVNGASWPFTSSWPEALPGIAVHLTAFSVLGMTQTASFVFFLFFTPMETKEWESTVQFVRLRGKSRVDFFKEWEDLAL